MSDMDAIVAKLNRSRAGLLSAVERVPAERWQKRSGNGGWSAAEVAAHLTMVETAVVSGATKWVHKEPKPVPVWKRLHLPPALEVLRLVKVKSPIPLDTRLVGEKDAMLERYRTVREQTMAFVEANRERDLRRGAGRTRSWAVSMGTPGSSSSGITSCATPSKSARL